MSIKYKGQLISGSPGKDAIINGQNTLEIVAGENVSIEQKDGTMTISSAGGGSTEEIYSTEETRIGTWIDGKPLYRRVFSVTAPSSTSTGVAVIKLDNDIRCINISGVIYSKDSAVLPVNYAHPTVGVSCWQNYGTAGNNSIYLRITTDSYKSVPAFIILEYTKTTDVSPVSQSVLALEDTSLSEVSTLASSAISSDTIAALPTSAISSNT